jgi:curved DNA-binding protein CbpA
MDPKVQLSIEVNTLHEILDELDYYRLLQLDPDCVQGEIEPAVRAASRKHHPDRVTAIGDADVSSKANEIFQRMKEAGDALGDPDKRAQYDEIIKAGILRMTDEALAIAEQERLKAENPEHATSHPKAEKYWHMALKDWEDKNFKGCVMNIQFAMTFDPENDVMKEWLEKAKGESSKQSAETKNPYKLRIV